MPELLLSNDAHPSIVLPRPAIKPSLPLRDAEQSTTRQPELAIMPSKRFVRAVHPEISPPSPNRRPTPSLRAELTLRSWLFSALLASTPSPGQWCSEPLRTVTFVRAP